ncbi:X-Pro aminopeptidase [Campylobacter mucosalis]|uniref:M24 family metallopeptidase n=1 Tax=Campylobacter mucosalis TaxID=202 RepID=UPI0004DA0307|nr:aminopeptidase P family protein [Campylobacter mucosalis]KEA46080.1 X-Pro aminopeptidase [Campylobacter mucosalis]QKF63495.1 Xaa-Pro dipeptidase, M24 metallopeptidase family [Campylobacter mucosalis]
MRNFILKNENAIYFSSGYSCDNAIFLCVDGKKFFLTDARYTTEAKERVDKDVAVIDAGRGLIKEARLILRKLKPKTLYFDPNDFSLSAYEALTKGVCVNFKKDVNLSFKEREIKDEKEIEILRKASQIGAKCFDEFAKFVRENGEGMSEKELHFNAELIFKQKNELGLSFSPIVAINENAAKAHALPTDKRLKRGDLLLLDAGVRYQNYCSDRTRTSCFDENFNFFKEQKFQDKKQQEVYEIVLKAQKAAIDVIKPGIRAKDIDLAAREVIASFGYEKQFIHSTGHGVGIDIHELPMINSKNETIIKEGMIFSVEPGIYLPGEFGVRIEDVVVVGKNGAEIL